MACTIIWVSGILLLLPKYAKRKGAAGMDSTLLLIAAAAWPMTFAVHMAWAFCCFFSFADFMWIKGKYLETEE